MRKRIYVAAPLFSIAERRFNIDLASNLAKDEDIFLPQRDGRLITDLLADGRSIDQAKRIIFECDLAALRAADLIIAVLDGQSVDEGVAVELGIAFALGKVCWGLKTDFRSMAWFGDNPMVEMVLARRFNDINLLRDSAIEFLKSNLMLPANTAQTHHSPYSSRNGC